jgi:hypothetical protein
MPPKAEMGSAITVNLQHGFESDLQTLCQANHNDRDDVPKAEMGSAITANLQHGLNQQ